MIDITEPITRVTQNSDATTLRWSHAGGRSRLANGVRVTLEFNRSLPLPAGETVRVRYDFTGNGAFLDCVGIAQATHVAARRGHLVTFHYRLSHWVPPSTLSRIREMHT